MKMQVIGTAMSATLVLATAAFAQQPTGTGPATELATLVVENLTLTWAPQGASGRGGTPPPSGQPLPGFMAPQPAPASVYTHGPQAFSVVLVVGDMEGTPGPDTVPAAARKALADLKDFLPYRNYRLLDSQWTLCCGRGPIFSRLRGLDEQEYELQLSPSVAGTAEKPIVTVRFVLAEAGSGTHVTTGNLTVTTTREAFAPASMQQRLHLEQEIAQLERQRESLLASRNESHPEVTQNLTSLRSRQMELEALRAAQGQRGKQTLAIPRSPRQIIDASFRMDVGETVVVGTSRIQGDKALIALLTAVPPKPGSAR